LRRKERLEIPVTDIPEGIAVCLKNAETFCSDARALVEKSSLQHALGLCIYAVEELGKAEMLKEMKAYRATSTSKVIFEREKAVDFFRNKPFKFLKKRGFSKKYEMNPFYNHCCKLLYAQSVIKMASDNRLLNSLGGKKTYQGLKEMFEAFKELDDPFYLSRTKTNGVREVAMYVDYDPKQGKWINGVPKITSENIFEFLEDIELEITFLKSELHEK
jgi:AbiV family abortive infection protein